MRRLFLHNNLTREKSEFQPANADLVTVYVCGPTVYGPAHIGNARPAVVFDVLVRLLRELYPAVSYARNITDIDDKINAAAAEEGVDIKVITDRYRAKYHEDMAALGVAPPDIEPHATEHIDDIIAMISELIARNAAYEAEGHVLFDVTQDAEYGRWRGVPAKTCWRVRGSKLPLQARCRRFCALETLKRRSAGLGKPVGRGVRLAYRMFCHDRPSFRADN